MPRTMIRAVLFALVGVGGVMPTAQAQPIDQWHYITDDSVLYTETVAGLHGAGVIQGDQIFAMLYLSLPDANGVVSVVLPTGNPAEEITSILVSPGGQRFERALSADELDVAPVGEIGHAYSFPISDTDVDLFKSALSWELRIGPDRWSVTLRGSRAAIEEAEAERARQFAELAREPAPAD